MVRCQRDSLCYLSIVALSDGSLGQGRTANLPIFRARDNSSRIALTSVACITALI
jgi:hypothetical protein